MTEEPWHKHTPGDPMPCKCGESVVEVRYRNGTVRAYPAEHWYWGKIEHSPYAEITVWRFVERKGEDVIAADPYDALEWDEDDTATVVMEKPGRPGWVLKYDQIRFERNSPFLSAYVWETSWETHFSFQIKRGPALTRAGQQVLEMLAVATDDDAAAIRRSARRANIEVPE